MDDDPLRRCATLRVPLLLFAMFLLPGCGGGEAPVDGEPATPRKEAPAAPVALKCMPTTLVSLRLPISEGLSVLQPGADAREPVIDCLLGLFGDKPLKSPLAFDGAYAAVFKFHEEDGTLRLATIPRESAQLFRLGDAGSAQLWLLRVDTGSDSGGTYYDVLLSTERETGALVDQMLVGASGVMYRRDYDIDTPTSFAIREDTGREETAGPGYRARYQVRDDGHFALVSAQVLPPQDEWNDDAPTVSRFSGTYTEMLPGAFGRLAPIRALLFQDGDIREVATVRIDAGASPVVLALGQTGKASLMLYVLSEVPTAAGGSTLYRVSSLALGSPVNASNAELADQDWEVLPDGRMRIELAMRYAVPRQGGNPDTGEREMLSLEARQVAYYDPANGALAPERTDTERAGTGPTRD